MSGSSNKATWPTEGEGDEDMSFCFWLWKCIGGLEVGTAAPWRSMRDVPGPRVTTCPELDAETGGERGERVRRVIYFQGRTERICTGCAVG